MDKTMNEVSLNINRLSNGTIFIGNIKEGHPDGMGWLIDEPRYQGEFKNGLKHGSGRLFYKDGKKIVAEFENDKFHGHSLTYIPFKNEVLDQQWDQNKLISMEQYKSDGSGAVCKSNEEGQQHGMQTFFLKDGTSHQILYENGVQIKHPNTGNIEGATEDKPNANFKKMIIETYEMNKTKFTNDIIWTLPEEVMKKIEEINSKKKD